MSENVLQVLLPELFDQRIQGHNSTVQEVSVIILQFLSINLFSDSAVNYDLSLKKLNSLGYSIFQSFCSRI